MKKYQLGEFEEVVILTIGVLYKDAYGVSIRKEIESRLSRNVSMGALHTALVRLEDKGYIKSFDGEATEERMGRPKRGEPRKKRPRQTSRRRAKRRRAVLRLNKGGAVRSGSGRIT